MTSSSFEAQIKLTRSRSTCIHCTVAEPKTCDTRSVIGDVTEIVLLKKITYCSYYV